MITTAAPSSLQCLVAWATTSSTVVPAKMACKATGTDEHFGGADNDYIDAVVDSTRLDARLGGLWGGHDTAVAREPEDFVRDNCEEVTEVTTVARLLLGRPPTKNSNRGGGGLPGRARRLRASHPPEHWRHPRRRTKDRGVIGSGPSLCPYSPECVEYEFSEVPLQHYA